MLSSLLHLDRAGTTWLAGQFSLAAQWVLLPFTAIGYSASVWFALTLGGFLLAPRLVARREPPISSELSPESASAAASRPPNQVACQIACQSDWMRMALWRTVLALLLTLLVVEHVCKPLVGRERPFIDGPKPSAIVWIPATSSFPSGHAASAAAGALALTRVWPTAAVPLAVLAAVIALSRVALGVHYVGDLLGGVLVGLMVAALATVRPVRTRP